MERESTLIPIKWSLAQGPTKGSGGGASARKSPFWEAPSYPPNTLKFRSARDTIAGGELLHKHFFPGTRAGSSERSDDEDEDSSNDAYEEEESE